MSNYTQRQETIDALASMVIEQADRHGFKIEIDAIRDAVEQMAKFAGIEANETEFMLASQKVEDEARLMGKLSEKSGEMENPQERYRLSAMDEGNDHYSVLDTKTQLYWSSEGWQRPDSGWASVLTRSEAARKAYELNRKLSNYIEHPTSGQPQEHFLNTDPSVIEAKVMKDYAHFLGKDVLVSRISGFVGDDSTDIELSPPAKVRVETTSEQSLKRWIDGWCDPVYEVVLVEDHPQLACVRSLWIHGPSLHLNGKQTEVSDIVSIAEPIAPRQDDTPSP